MKALRVRQPWTWLIVAEFKDIEIGPGRRNPGGICLQAGKKLTPEDFPAQWAYLRSIAIDLPADLALAYRGKRGFFELDEAYLGE